MMIVKTKHHVPTITNGYSAKTSIDIARKVPCGEDSSLKCWPGFCLGGENCENILVRRGGRCNNVYIWASLGLENKLVCV